MAAASGFTLALAAWAAGKRATLWIAEDMALAESGALYGPGLEDFGLRPEQLIRVAVAQERAVLWAMEEGLRCRGVGAVIGEVRAGRGVGPDREPPSGACPPDAQGGTAFLLRAAPASAAARRRQSLDRRHRARGGQCARARAAASGRQSHAQPAGQPGIVGIGVEQCRAAFRARNGSPACGCGGLRPTGIARQRAA